MMPDKLNLQGKRALITGGSAGIGLAVAEALGRAGCDLAIVARRREQLEEAEQYLRERVPDSRLAILSADVSRVADIKEMVEEAERQIGPLDILVNNAGTNKLNDALDITEEEWDRIMNLNLKGLFFCCQEAGRRMVRRGSGTIVNIASQMGLVGYKQRAVYCSSKGGVVQLTKVLAIEWAPHGIRVNAVAPTFIETPLTSTMLANPAFVNEVMPRIPMGRFATVDPVADAVLSWPPACPTW